VVITAEDCRIITDALANLIITTPGRNFIWWSPSPRDSSIWLSVFPQLLRSDAHHGKLHPGQIEAAHVPPRGAVRGAAVATGDAVRGLAWEIRPGVDRPHLAGRVSVAGGARTARTRSRNL